MNIDDLTEKLISEGKSLDILDKIKFIKNEISNNALNNITNLALFIQDLFKRRNIDFEEEKDKDNNNNENKYSQYNDVKENLFNILSREEVNNDQNNNNELIKMDDKSNENKMEIEPISPSQKPETQPNLIQKGKEEKKEEQFTGK
jgi:anionic cell wall polymer biosynthesis LytR-Cps2A-Psr (LCP) family protein